MDFSNISRQDAITTLEIIYEIIRVESVEGLSRLLEKCKKLIPFDKSLYGYGLRTKATDPYSNNIVGCCYPESWMEEYVKNDYYSVDPVYKCNMSEFGLQRWKYTYKILPPPDNFIKKALSFDLKDGYSFGLPDRKSHFASLFSISGCDLEFNDREKKLIELLFPCFHVAIEKITSGEITSKKFNKIFVTEQEIEILKWLTNGKTTWDISQILKISENTVKYHIKKLMKKFEVFNRVHLVSVALSMKLF